MLMIKACRICTHLEVEGNVVNFHILLPSEIVCAIVAVVQKCLKHVHIQGQREREKQANISITVHC